MKILIIEDDECISRLIETLLVKNDFECEAAFSGTEARLLLSMHTYDLLICDLNLPGLSGEELIKEQRKSSNVPILVLTAKESIDDKINVLGLGADDYMTKPFDNRELLARVKARLRRTEIPSNPSVLRYKDLSLYPQQQKVLAGEEEVHLTLHEFEILKLLMENPERVFSKENLYQLIWKCEYYGEDNTVSVHVSNLRKKLALKSDQEYIQTVWGIGFKLQG